VVLLACARTGQAQFAQSVILNGWLKAATKAQATISSALGANVSLADVEEAPAPRLPACRYERLLSTQGVPTGWGTTMEMQDMVAHPINAAMLQLVRSALAPVVLCADPAAAHHSSRVTHHHDPTHPRTRRRMPCGRTTLLLCWASAWTTWVLTRSPAASSTRQCFRIWVP
jgi:hypothetical protein